MQRARERERDDADDWSEAVGLLGFYRASATTTTMTSHRFVAGAENHARWSMIVIRECLHEFCTAPSSIPFPVSSLLQSLSPDGSALMASTHFFFLRPRNASVARQWGAKS